MSGPEATVDRAAGPAQDLTGWIRRTYQIDQQVRAGRRLCVRKTAEVVYVFACAHVYGLLYADEGWGILLHA